MKITKLQIKKIIQEELQNVLDEEEMDENANYLLFNKSNSLYVGPGAAPQEPNWVSFERASKMSLGNAAWFRTSYGTENPGETLELVKVKEESQPSGPTDADVKRFKQGVRRRLRRIRVGHHVPGGST